MFLLRDDINEIATLVKAGNVICFPTDTVWALGCDATNSAAVQRVRDIKNTPPQEGLVVMVSSIEMLKSLVTGIPPRIETLLSLHARPLTLIYSRFSGLAPNTAAADGSVAIRITHDPFCIQLIEKAGGPIVASGACLSNATYPSTFGGISSDILGQADYVVKHRQDDKTPAQASPIARLDAFQELEFIRE